MDFVFAVIGLAALVAAGDALVRGAVALSLRLGVSALVVSLTVVAFGTSAPELIVGVQAALRDAPGIVYGNVVGSNIANVLLVLGVPALIAPVQPADGDSRRMFWMMIAASLGFIALCFVGPLTWWHGIVLLAALAWVLLDCFRAARTSDDGAVAAELAEIEEADPHMAPWAIGALIGAGVVGLPVGAHFLVEGARGIAASAGLSEAAIGLTLVAVGTSLPELMTTVMAALRRHADVAVGNVIGSNIFNLLGIMGVSSLVAPLAVPPEFLRLDLWVMLASSALLWGLVGPRWIVGRGLGAGLLALYLLYLVIVLVPRM
ncbi:MAG: sodium:calcium antiporter [Rhodobacteraceae bacterium]|nr:MAG: sodium:calcium antiporter [Paracoccaceae bacterium]